MVKWLVLKIHFELISTRVIVLNGFSTYGPRVTNLFLSSPLQKSLQPTLPKVPAHPRHTQS